MDKLLYELKNRIMRSTDIPIDVKQDLANDVFEIEKASVHQRQYYEAKILEWSGLYGDDKFREFFGIEVYK